MLSEKTKRYIKLVNDMIGIFVTIGILIIIALHFYMNIEPNGSSELGFKVTGPSMVTLYILIAVAIITILISFMCKRQEKTR
ncbi:hypothetical protein BU068_11415 [Staphylococcus succinus]|uniref:hypothetical protein n=1 Tax=Staphylococcus succinus TaxID=61015 RepID=UPI000E68E346|nr:hypothetical protein [Staphylococcus succinus]RIN30371.1 hypothetical protein BU068_11415 [Staphylococcus succinus]